MYVQDDLFYVKTSLEDRKEGKRCLRLRQVYQIYDPQSYAKNTMGFKSILFDVEVNLKKSVG